MKEGSRTGSKISKNKSKNSSGESKTEQKYVYKEVPSLEVSHKIKQTQHSMKEDYFSDRFNFQSSPPNKSEMQDDDNFADIDNYTVFSGIKGTFYSNYRNDSFISADPKRASFKHQQVAHKIHGSKMKQAELTQQQQELIGIINEQRLEKIKANLN